jgi:DNA-binding PadR family transcriptional regulator
VFSGKEATLNRAILQVLERQNPLIAYDVWHVLRAIKGFGHAEYKTVYRRMASLAQEGWINSKGARKVKAGWICIQYELSVRGKAALELNKIDLHNFLLKADEEQVEHLLSAFSRRPKSL